jgi:hypothetical protein
VITDNTGSNGGGIDAEYGAPIILNCLIARNFGSSMGGGIFASNAFIWGCTIVDNETMLFGGAVAGNAQIHSSILWGNEPDEADADVIISYSDVQGGWPGTGNIDADPLFVDQLGGDYHLQAGSPCVDAGDPGYSPLPGEVDLDGQRRVWDGNGDGQPRADMGVDEYGSFVYGDVNCDSSVSFGDINPFVLTLTDPGAYEIAFPNCDILNADINGDGSVNFRDINPFVALLTGM